MEYIDDYLLPHWPFVMTAVIFMLVGQVMKTAVWTKERAHKKGKVQWLFWWAYKTLPLHPVLSGCVVGLAWHNPESSDPAWPIIASCFYFMGAGTLSVWLYQILKGLAKKRGVDLGELPGQSQPPSKPAGDK